jgi:hypothetical protein
MQLFIESEIRDITSFRALAARLAGVAPGPEGSIGKMASANLTKDILG